jgi:hypothetical protein
MGRQANLLPSSELAVGWISRNILASGRGGVFFLTSLFIELIDPARPLTGVLTAWGFFAKEN